MLLNFVTDETQVSIDVKKDGQDWLLNIDGQEVPLQAKQHRSGVWLVDTHQGRRRLWVARRNDEYLVFCDGKVHTLRLRSEDHDDDDHDFGAGPNLVADMPGKVVQVKVQVGQEVEAGQTLVIMESMKMETELAAAARGRIEAIHVENGQLVGQGDALVDLQIES